MRQLLDEGNGTDIHRVARDLLKGTNAALTENHVAIALRKDVFCGQQPFFDGGRHTAFEHYRFACATYFIEEHVVLHIASADLQDIGVFTDHGNIGGGHDLGNHGQAEL